MCCISDIEGWDTNCLLIETGTAECNNLSGYSDIGGAKVQNVIISRFPLPTDVFDKG